MATVSVEVDMEDLARSMTEADLMDLLAELADRDFDMDSLAESHTGSRWHRNATEFVQRVLNTLRSLEDEK